jgi:hypothetical protein
MGARRQRPVAIRNFQHVVMQYAVIRMVTDGRRMRIEATQIPEGNRIVIEINDVDRLELS